MKTSESFVKNLKAGNAIFVITEEILRRSNTQRFLVTRVALMAVKVRTERSEDGDEDDEEAAIRYGDDVDSESA